MENYIDKAIELLQQLKENEGIAHTVSIEYGFGETIDQNGNFVKAKDGSFTIEVSGSGLRVALDKLK